MEKERLDLLDLVAGNTVSYRQKQWIDNFFANQDEIRNGFGVISLTGTLIDVPAILVGSGPALAYNIDQLAGLQNRCCIVAGLSSLHGLIDAGVKPHLVMATDSKERCVEFMNNLDISELTFVADTFIHPVLTERLKDARRVYWYNTLEMERFSFTAILDKYTGFVGKISTGGCGLTTGWCMARNTLKCDPDILVGVPESFYDPGTPYKPGSEQQYATLLTKHHTVENYESPNIEMRDAWGRLAYTKAGFLSFAYWFYQAFVDVPGIHINCTEGGIIKENCLNMSLEFCSNRYLKAEYDIEGRLFAHERMAAEVMAALDMPENHRQVLTILAGGPSKPTLMLRKGWTDEEAEQVISYMQGLGVKIKVSPHVMGDGVGNRIDTVQYTLEGVDENAGRDMRKEREQEVPGEEPSGD